MLGIKLLVLVFALLNFGCAEVVEEEDTALDTEEDADAGTADADTRDAAETPEDAAEDNREEEPAEGHACVEDLSGLSAEEIYEKVYFQEMPTAIYLRIPICHWCELYGPVYEAVCQYRSEEMKFYKFVYTFKDGELEPPISFDPGYAFPVTFYFYLTNEPVLTDFGYKDEEELNQVIDEFLAEIEG